MPVTLITGSSTGIGRATVLELARRGHTVFASMRDPRAAEPLLGIARQESLQIRAVALDVTDADSVARAVAEVIGSAGRLDVLISNAGFHAGNALEETDLAVFRNLMDTNFFGSIRCIQAVLPHFRHNRAGTIVSVTSQSGRFVHPTCGAYCASKFATEAALEVLALEVAQFGIRVALIEPGLTFTAAQSKGQPWPAETPYQETYRRTGAVFASSATEGSSAELVATAIAAALQDRSPRLRYLVGVDARRNLSGRAGLSDEQWVAMHALEDTGEFFARWGDAFGLDPTPASKGQA